MNKQIDTPQEIKRWNWGAFLLCPIWCIRHGIWHGLLLLVPIFGFFVPFWLGATGNQKAWVKNCHESVEVFLRRQRRWGLAGLIIWAGVILTSLGFLSYSLNYSDGMKMGLNTANSNKRLVGYFGDSIHKRSFFNGSYNYIVAPTPSMLAVSFDAIGSKSTGSMRFQWEKRGEDWIATEIAFVDSEGATHQLVDALMIEGSFLSKVPYAKNTLEAALTRMIEEKEGYVILSRSKEKNDFIQTAVDISDEEEIAFSVVYSDGYTRWNKNLYRSKNPIKNKEDVIRMFSLYARGDDVHVSSVGWDKLTSIKPEGNSTAVFVFGEAEE